MAKLADAKARSVLRFRVTPIPCVSDQLWQTPTKGPSSQSTTQSTVGTVLCSDARARDTTPTNPPRSRVGRMTDRVRSGRVTSVRLPSPGRWRRAQFAKLVVDILQRLDHPVTNLSRLLHLSAGGSNCRYSVAATQDRRVRIRPRSKRPFSAE